MKSHRGKLPNSIQELLHSSGIIHPDISQTLFHFGPSLIHALEFHSLWPKHGAFADSALYKSLDWFFPLVLAALTQEVEEIWSSLFTFGFGYLIIGCLHVLLSDCTEKDTHLSVFKANGTHLEHNMQMLQSLSGCNIWLLY